MKSRAKMTRDGVKFASTRMWPVTGVLNGVKPTRYADFGLVTGYVAEAHIRGRTYGFGQRLSEMPSVAQLTPMCFDDAFQRDADAWAAMLVGNAWLHVRRSLTAQGMDDVRHAMALAMVRDYSRRSTYDIINCTPALAAHLHTYVAFRFGASKDILPGPGAINPTEYDGLARLDELALAARGEYGDTDGAEPDHTPLPPMTYDMGVGTVTASWKRITRPGRTTIAPVQSVGGGLDAAKKPLDIDI